MTWNTVPPPPPPDDACRARARQIIPVPPPPIGAKRTVVTHDPKRPISFDNPDDALLDAMVEVDAMTPALPPLIDMRKPFGQCP